ncbi:hypothetical protein OMP38_24455 [Cohnella ginsengisoli]|uniref:Tetratricopeptide repeat protein n=1 Tax=Cohnella ginsengisoli TaxID=425004 RepID=A0A9X4KKC9_9BACL|nr:CDC27 family protein [Cohnella ginsengisoli]MDG0793628.1 hypothetical protein [Cohnella ginsengisoli]
MEQAAWQASYRAAEQLIEWKRYKEALEETQRLLALDPEDADALALAGRVHLCMDRHQEALHWAQEALRRDPEHLLAWFVRVSAYYETGRLKEFQEALAEALRLDPYESFYYYLNANYYNKKRTILVRQVRAAERAGDTAPQSRLSRPAQLCRSAPWRLRGIRAARRPGDPPRWRDAARAASSGLGCPHARRLQA